MSTFVGTDLQLINALREAAKRQGGTVGALCNAAADALAGIQMSEGLEALVKSGGDVSLQVLIDVINERYRQIAVEGWTPEHDDRHGPAVLAAAAGCYALHAYDDSEPKNFAPAWWPFDADWYKSTTAERDMIKSIALGLAALEAEYRARAKGSEGAALPARSTAPGQGLHGPFGWLNGHRALSEDSWELENVPIGNNEEYFAIPLYALVDPFKEIGRDFKSDKPIDDGGDA